MVFNGGLIFILGDNITSQQRQLLHVIKEKVKQTTENRPTRDQALGIAYQCMKQAMDLLTDIYNRENEFHLYQDIYNKRKQDLKNV